MESIIFRLKSQSTWKLLFLGLISLGIYYAHYIYRQTKVINEFSPNDEKKISNGWIVPIFILAYTNAFSVFLPSFLAPDNPYEIYFNVLSYVCIILYVIWTTMSISRVNEILSIESEMGFWVIWAILFTALYFNFTVNTLSEQFEESQEETGSTLDSINNCVYEYSRENQEDL